MGFPWLMMLCVALLGLLLCEWKRWRAGIWLFKPVASAAFVTGGVDTYLRLSADPSVGGELWSLSPPAYAQWILAGLCLSFAGDLLLIPRKKGVFLAGIAAFMGAHLAYSSAFLGFIRHEGGSWGGLALGAGVALPTAFFAMRAFLPRLTGNVRRAVPVYIGLISIMVCLAFAANQPLARMGAACFFVSDLAVARQRFVQESFWNKMWGLPLYYLAQTFFVLSLKA